MKRKSSIAFLYTLIATICLFSCKKNSDTTVTTGQLKGIVKDATTSSPLENVSLVIFNADNNSPIGQTLKTNASGEFSADLSPGNYFLKLSRQGYYPVPPPTLDAVPFGISLGQLTQSDAAMFPFSTSNAGWIVANVPSSGSPVKGALA